MGQSQITERVRIPEPVDAVAARHNKLESIDQVEGRDRKANCALPAESPPESETGRNGADLLLKAGKATSERL